MNSETKLVAMNVVDSTYVDLDNETLTPEINDATDFQMFPVKKFVKLWLEKEFGVPLQYKKIVSISGTLSLPFDMVQGEGIEQE